MINFFPFPLFISKKRMRSKRIRICIYIFTLPHTKKNNNKTFYTTCTFILLRFIYVIGFLGTTLIFSCTYALHRNLLPLFWDSLNFGLNSNYKVCSICYLSRSSVFLSSISSATYSFLRNFRMYKNYQSTNDNLFDTLVIKLIYFQIFMLALFL